MIAKPYWVSPDGMHAIYNADNIKILQELPPGSIDLVVTDPPYGVGFKYDSFDDKLTPDQWLAWIEPIFKECRRVSLTTLLTGQAGLPQLARIEAWAWLLQWWKPAAMGRSPMGVNNWEPIAVYGKMPKAKVNDVIRACIIPDASVEGHPCPKPLQWAVGQLMLWPEATSVLDPFLGSGTVMVAAHRTGRRSIGIEISEEYCKIAVRRMELELKKPTLALFSPKKTEHRGLSLFNS